MAVRPGSPWTAPGSSCRAPPCPVMPLPESAARPAGPSAAIGQPPPPRRAPLTPHSSPSQERRAGRKQGWGGHSQGAPSHASPRVLSLGFPDGGSNLEVSVVETDYKNYALLHTESGPSPGPAFRMATLYSTCASPGPAAWPAPTSRAEGRRGTGGVGIPTPAPGQRLLLPAQAAARPRGPRSGRSSPPSPRRGASQRTALSSCRATVRGRQSGWEGIRRQTDRLQIPGRPRAAVLSGQTAHWPEHGLRRGGSESLPGAHGLQPPGRAQEDTPPGDIPPGSPSTCRPRVSTQDTWVLGLEGAGTRNRTHGAGCPRGHRDTSHTGVQTRPTAMTSLGQGVCSGPRWGQDPLSVGRSRAWTRGGSDGLWWQFSDQPRRSPGL